MVLLGMVVGKMLRRTV
jgi:hypothetical protein